MQNDIYVVRYGGILPIRPEVNILPIYRGYRPTHRPTVLYNYINYARVLVSAQQTNLLP